MDNSSHLPVVAIFANRGMADSAIDALLHAGFLKSEIGLASPGEHLHEADTATEQLEERAAHGASTGAVTGGVLGAFAGMIAVATIPGFGPVLLGGLLLGSLGGAAAGAALGTFAGPFVAMGLKEKDAQRAMQRSSGWVERSWSSNRKTGRTKRRVSCTITDRAAWKWRGTC